METTISLSKPRTSGGLPLMDALRSRCSTRDFADKDLSLQELSDLLWAAFGLSREDGGTGFGTSGSHTAPTAVNWQEIDVYVAKPEGLYLYEPHAHGLRAVVDTDVRPWAAHPAQQWVAEVPTVLIYVADFARMINASDQDKRVYPYTDSAFIAENVYLYCASAGLATVVRALMDQEGLARAMKLRPDQLVTLNQPVGYAR